MLPPKLHLAKIEEEKKDMLELKRMQAEEKRKQMELKKKQK
jgi:hypothetical protein